MKLTGSRIGALSPTLAEELATRVGDPGARLRLENIERSWREAALERARGSLSDELMEELHQLARTPDVTAAQLTQTHLPRLIAQQRAAPPAFPPPIEPFGELSPAFARAVRGDRYAPYQRPPAAGRGAAPAPPPPPPPVAGRARERWLRTALLFFRTALPPMTANEAACAISVATAGVMTLSALYMIQNTVPTLRAIMGLQYQPIIAAISAVVSGLIAGWGGALAAIVGAIFPRGSITEAMTFDSSLWRAGDPVTWMRQSDFSTMGSATSTPPGVALYDNARVAREIINGNDRWLRVRGNTDATRAIVSELPPRNALIIEFGSIDRPTDVSGTRWMRARTSMGSMYIDLTHRHVWVPIEFDTTTDEARLWQNQMQSVQTNAPPPDQGPRFAAELRPVNLQTTTRPTQPRPGEPRENEPVVGRTVDVPDMTVESIYKAASLPSLAMRYSMP